MIVRRLITYEGDSKGLDIQLGQSMNDGERRTSNGVTITVTTIPSAYGLFKNIRLLLKYLMKKEVN